MKTNIIGTENVLQSAIHQNVKKVICLSTDKAAYPINAMGISKAMMEKVFVAKSRNIRSEQTLICGTRYGNVMASRGSEYNFVYRQNQSWRTFNDYRLLYDKIFNELRRCGRTSCSCI